jgi:two-component system sensor histidine kinase PilS (NtrC family)
LAISAVAGVLSNRSVSKPYLSKRLQWLMFLRVVFTTVLLGSTIIVQFKDQESLIAPPHLILYGLIGAIYVLTFIYVLFFKRFQPALGLAYLQISLDTLFVTLLIYVTGGIASVFSFLYLVVIVYASILLYKKGSFVMAVLCSIQYGAMMDLEYYGILRPFFTQATLSMHTYEPAYVLYKIVMTMVACFLVAFLSSHLAQQTLRTEEELEAKQKDLKQLEAFNASIVHSMESGLLTLGSSDKITSFNRAAEQITGFKREEVLGQPLVAIFPGVVEQLTAPGEFFQKRLQRYHVEFKKKNGAVGYLGFSVSSLMEPDGRAIGKLLIFQDLTALKIMEAHIKRVDKLAAVGEMAAGIAHEIKNPLASMTGSIQLLKDQISVTSVTQKLMRIALREADRLNDLTNDFLLFARPNSGKAEAVELGSAVDETLALFEQDAVRHNGVRVVRHLAPDLWTEMDPKHIRQVLWNLLLNAAEAIDGKGTIEVSANIINDSLQLAIKDDGCGIPEETQKTVFDPFFTTKTQGTGLGLSIVHRLVESYGGRVDVESEEGQGTTFILHLKRIDPPGRVQSGLLS